jgi:hypothetical protein
MKGERLVVLATAFAILLKQPHHQYPTIPSGP